MACIATSTGVVVVIVWPLRVMWVCGGRGWYRGLVMCNGWLVRVRVMDGGSSSSGGGVVVIIVPGIYIRTCVIVIRIGRV